VFSLRHVTYRERAPWLNRKEFEKKTIAERVRYVRSNIKGAADDGGMTQPEFATAVGVSGHHAVLNWEKARTQPRRMKRKIAALTPYEPEDFVADGGSRPTTSILGRLEALEAQAANLATKQELREGLETLRAAIDQLASPDNAEVRPVAGQNG
jgi:DNA-binding transcriptional regulator YiaG